MQKRLCSRIVFIKQKYHLVSNWWLVLLMYCTSLGFLLSYFSQIYWEKPQTRKFWVSFIWDQYGKNEKRRVEILIASYHSQWKIRLGSNKRGLLQERNDIFNSLYLLDARVGENFYLFHVLPTMCCELTKKELRWTQEKRFPNLYKRGKPTKTAFRYFFRFFSVCFRFFPLPRSQISAFSTRWGGNPGLRMKTLLWTHININLGSSLL